MTSPPDTIVKPQTTFVVVEQAELERPYRVIIQNDDVTPMEFVIFVLTTVFALAVQAAVDVMLMAHHHGEAVVAVLPYQEASDKVYRAHDLADQNGYPLRFYLEPAESA
jgi:ATP-dependent Clp protease adaptor protein ClpS